MSLSAFYCKTKLLILNVDQFVDGSWRCEAIIESIVSIIYVNNPKTSILECGANIIEGNGRVQHFPVSIWTDRKR